MPASHRHAFALAVAACLLAGTAQAKVSGSCVYEQRTVTFMDGAAWQLPAEEEDDDEYDFYDDDDADDESAAAPAGPPVKVAFATVKLDAGAVARASDRDDDVQEQIWARDGDHGRLTLTIEGSLVSEQSFWMSPGTSASYSGNDVGHLKPGAAKPGRVAGSYRFTPEDGQDITCNVSFDLALLGDAAAAPPPPPPPGTPLPPDGGAPGKAYLAMNKALHSGDFEAIARLMPASRAGEIEQMRNDPDRDAMLEMARALSPTKVKITGGRQDGDKAWVEFTALEGDHPRVGTAEMQREGSTWYMLRESTRDPD